MVEVEGTLYCDAPGCTHTAQGFIQFHITGGMQIRTAPNAPEWCIARGNLLCPKCGSPHLPNHPPPISTKQMWTPKGVPTTPPENSGPKEE